MMRSKHVCGWLIACVMTAGVLQGMDINLPFDPVKIADKAQSAGLPKGVTVTEELGALKIASDAGVKLTETVTVEESVGIPSQVAGREVLVKIKVSGQDFRFDGGQSGASISIAGSAVALPRGNFGWRTINTKVKCPANGKLPITVKLQNFSGTLMLKEPIAHIDLPRTLPKGLKKRRK